MSTTDMTNPWRRGDTKASAKNKRRAAIVRAQSRRKAKTECRHRYTFWTDSPLALHCLACTARLSLGPSNDDVPVVEMLAAFRDLNVWIQDDGGSMVWSDDADGWPWDPTRPVAGQYEQWLNRAGICYPGDDAFAQLCKDATKLIDAKLAEIDKHDNVSMAARLADTAFAQLCETEPGAAKAYYDAKEAAIDAHGYAKPGKAPAEVVGLDGLEPDRVTATRMLLNAGVELVVDGKQVVGVESQRSVDSDAPAATYEPGGAE